MLPLPLASSSGDAIMVVVILASVLAIWWLLRAEAREDTPEGAAEERAGGDG